MIIFVGLPRKCKGGYFQNFMGCKQKQPIVTMWTFMANECTPVEIDMCNPPSGNIFKTLEACEDTCV